MNRDRLLRLADEVVFDWRGPASACNVSEDVARTLYVRAIQCVFDVRLAEVLYRRWLSEEAAERHVAESAPVPGRMTRWMLELAHDHAPRPALDAEVEPVELQAAWARFDQSAWARDWLAAHPPRRKDGATPSVPGRRTLVSQAADTGPGLDDYRVLGLEAMLKQLGPDHRLRSDTLAAAVYTDRSIAGRATRWREALPGAATPGATPSDGAALWQVAERHATTLYRRAAHRGLVDMRDPAVEAALQQRSAGQPLPAELCQEMKRELGVALTDVRVHTDAVAAQAARALDAEAFTLGENIFFASGAFAPETPSGRNLLAHELTHVAQALCGGKRPARSELRVSQPGEPHEQEADRVAERVASTSQPQVEPGDAGSAARSLRRRLPERQIGRIEQAFGRRFDDVELHLDSPEVPAGGEAVTRGRHIHFEAGAFDPASAHGEQVIAHELAHVAQQSLPDAGAGLVSRSALEADAHQATIDVFAGRAARVHLAAPKTAALGFSRGEPRHAPTSGRPAPHTTRGTAHAPRPTVSPAGHPATSSAPSGHRMPPPGAAAPPGPAPRPGPPDQSATAIPASAMPTGAGARGPAHDGVLMPEAPAALTPAALARLRSVSACNHGVARAVTALPTAEQQTAVARNAVAEPQAEQDARAQHSVVASVDNRPPPSPEIEAACARIRVVIRAQRPPSEDRLVDARPREMAQQAGEQMSAGVEHRAGSVRQSYADMQQRPQGHPSRAPVPATLPPARVETPSVDAGTGAPDPLQLHDVSLDRDVAAQRQRIQDTGMNTEPGRLVNDGPIGDARGGVSDLQTMSQTNSRQVLAQQAAAVAHARSDMQALQAAAVQAMAQARAGTVAHITTHTSGVRASEEHQRAAAGAQMQAIFTHTQASVDRLLQPLSGAAVARWEAGVAQLSSAFESALAEVKHRIDARHHGDGSVLGEIGAGLTSLGDQVFGLPDWVVHDYDRAEAAFADGATSQIRDISRDVNAVIEDCKQLIARARSDIDAIVHSLPANLQAWAHGEATRLGHELDQLGQRVDQTQHGLNHDLVNRANTAVQQVREQVAALREQARRLIGQIADAITAFLENPGKAIVDGLLRLVGIPPTNFWALIDRLGNVIDGIAADPMRFANTLMAGVGQGFQQFFHNLPTHLGQALFQWLFSKLGEAGVTVPSDFSLRSILGLVLDVLGISWTRIRTILAHHIGEQNAQLLDQAYQIISTLIERGPQGLIDMFVERLNPATIVDMIKDAVLHYIIEAIVTRVTARILMMLNPAGAILQAIEAIYRVIRWVIDNAARIFTLIESIVSGAEQILAGNTVGVANLVESSLVRLIVPVIDFLAGYLGLGGIPNAIRDLILGLQQRVEQILDRVIGFVIDRARALWNAIRGGGARGGQGDPTQPQDRNAEIGVPITFEAARHGHRLWIEVTGSSATVMVASTPMPVTQQLSQMRSRLSSLPPDKQSIAAELLARAEAALQQTDAQADQAVRTTDPGRGAAVRPQEHSLADVMKALFETFGPTDGPLFDHPAPMHGHGHTLHVSAQGGRLVVELASRRELLRMLALDAKQQEERGQHRAGLLNLLSMIETKLRELLEYERAGTYSTMPLDDIRMWTEAMATMLVSLGTEFQIEDLQNLGHPSRYAESNMLKEEYRPVVRRTFYGTNYVDATEDWKARRLATLINPNDPTQFRDELEGTWEPRSLNGRTDDNVTIDHAHKVVDHWNTGGGNNMNQSGRRLFYNNTSDLRLTARRNNSADGARAAAEGARYTPNVGPNFRGPGENE